MAEFYITDAAAEDIEHHWNQYIERGGSESNADSWVLELFKGFQNLADFPDIGTPRNYLPPRVLALPHNTYIIVYRKRSEGIDILNVVYGGMDLQRFFSNKSY